MTWYEKLDKAIEVYLPDLPLERDVPMSRYTSFRIGGPARRLACPKNREQLVILMGLARECGAKPFVMGNGTNLLVSDKGLERLVIRTAGEMCAVKAVDETTIEADAGISLARLALSAQGESLTGLEFAHGIPGTVGGAQVSEKHAGFIINRGGATAADILTLIREVQRRVMAEKGVARQPEVKLLEP